MTARGATSSEVGFGLCRAALGWVAPQAILRMRHYIPFGIEVF